MSRQISRAESWEKIHHAFQNINFAAFDYNSVKQSLIDYIKLYFPEYNNFIESDELIMQIEAFAYIAELFAYRLDVTAHENLMPLAQRKDSILRLAKLISYTASRNLPARGLVKITSVQTNENVYDSNGTNLANTKIIWNDLTNANWKEQFILVMNQVMVHEFGTVHPNDRVQVYDQIFELYTLNNIPLQDSVISYNAISSGITYPMELTSVALNAAGPYERRPERNTTFSILYGSDGLGDSSNTTGFFMFTKQGSLASTKKTFDGITPNQTFDILIDNINDTDVWVNNVDNVTGNILNNTATTQARSGEWFPVNTAFAENIIYNTDKNRNKYEIETLDKDNIRLVFGDGEFSNIPSGTFEVWYRISANADIVIPTTAIYELKSSMSYTGNNNETKAFTFTFSSINTIQNSAPSEDMEHIRRVASSVYYTQDRMVNTQDYNTYLLQDQSILKLKAVNRSFAGQSKYMHWYDASSTYENVKLFGDDLAVYYTESVSQISNIPNNATAATVVTNYIEPLLSNNNTYMFRVLQEYTNATRRYFTENEKHNIIYNSLGELYLVTDITPFEPVFPVRIKYDLDPTTSQFGWVPYYTTSNTDDTWAFMIDRVFNGIDYIWSVSYKTLKISIESNTTNFWYANNKNIINYETLSVQNDKVTILKANTGNIRTTANTNILPSNMDLLIVGPEYYDDNLQEVGVVNYNALTVAPPDVNNDLWPDNIQLSGLMNNIITVNNPQVINFDYPILNSDITIVGDVDSSQVVTISQYNNIVSGITVTSLGNNSELIITISDFVYFYRSTVGAKWTVIPTNITNIQNWYSDVNNLQYKRLPGRSQLNFLWTHYTSTYHLVDPNTSNIIDAFVLTRGYYISMRRWLDGESNVKPSLPTPQELSTTYNALSQSKMISDSLVLHPAELKILFGSNAIPQLQATFVVVKSPQTTYTDNQVKTAIITSIISFFDINDWDFGDTFNFTELAAKIHYDLQQHIDTVVLVPKYESNYFGDLFQVNISEDTIIIPDVTMADISIVTALNHNNIKQFKN
jgi:hypothetical protein